MTKIELGLHQHHALYQASNASATPGLSQVSMRGGTAATDQGLVETPFAKVNSVVPGSPADDAGLKAGDRIRRFGDVNWLNHEKLGKVAELVQRNQGVSLLSPSLMELCSSGSAQAKCGCEGGSKRGGIDVAANPEKQLGRSGSARLPLASSLIFWPGREPLGRV